MRHSYVSIWEIMDLRERVLKESELKFLTFVVSIAVKWYLLQTFVPVFFYLIKTHFMHNKYAKHTNGCSGL